MLLKNFSSFLGPLTLYFAKVNALTISSDTYMHNGDITEETTVNEGIHLSMESGNIETIKYSLNVEGTFYIGDTNSNDPGLQATFSGPHIENHGSIIVDGRNASSGSMSVKFGGSSIVNNGKIYLHGPSSKTNTFNLNPSSFLENNGLITIGQDEDSGYSSTVHIKSGTITNDGTICFKNVKAYLDSSISGSGCITIGDNTVYGIQSDRRYGKLGPQTLYMSSPSSIIYVDAAGLTDNIIVRGFGGGNCLSFGTTVETYSYNPDTGILSFTIFAFITHKFNIGKGYDKNKFIVKGINNHIGLSLINNALYYSGDDPNGVPSACRPCEMVSSITATTTSSEIVSVTTSSEMASSTTDATTFSDMVSLTTFEMISLTSFEMISLTTFEMVSVTTSSETVSFTTDATTTFEMASSTTDATTTSEMASSTTYATITSEMVSFTTATITSSEMMSSITDAFTTSEMVSSTTDASTSSEKLFSTTSEMISFTTSELSSSTTSERTPFISFSTATASTASITSSTTYFKVSYLTSATTILNETFATTFFINSFTASTTATSFNMHSKSNHTFEVNDSTEKSSTAISLTTVLSDETSTTVIYDTSSTTMMSDISTTSMLSEVSSATTLSNISSTSMLSEVSSATTLSNISSTTMLSEVSSATTLSNISSTTMLSEVSSATTLSNISSTTVLSDISSTTVLSDISSTTMLYDTSSTTTLSNSSSTTVVSNISSTTTLSNSSSTTVVSNISSTTTLSNSSSTTVVSNISSTTTSSNTSSAATPSLHSTQTRPATNSSINSKEIANQSSKHVSMTKVTTVVTTEGHVVTLTTHIPCPFSNSAAAVILSQSTSTCIKSGSQHVSHVDTSSKSKLLSAEKASEEPTKSVYITAKQTNTQPPPSVKNSSHTNDVSSAVNDAGTRTSDLVYPGHSHSEQSREIAGDTRKATDKPVASTTVKSLPTADIQQQTSSAISNERSAITTKTNADASKMPGDNIISTTISVQSRITSRSSFTSRISLQQAVNGGSQNKWYGPLLSIFLLFTSLYI
ncbi:cell wall protein Iff9p [Monosporozyma servazzii]